MAKCGKVGQVISDIGSWIDDEVHNIANGISDIGSQFDDAILQPLVEVAKTIASDPIGSVAKVAAIASGQWWALPLVTGVDVAAHGGDFGDVMKAAAVSWVAQEVGLKVGEYAASLPASVEYGTDFFSQQSLQLAAQEAGLGTGIGVASSILGSAVSSAAKVEITGGNAVAALLSGGINAGTSALLGNVPGFTKLPSAIQGILSAASSASLAKNLLNSAGSVTAAVANAAISGVDKALGLTTKVLTTVNDAISSAVSAGKDVAQVVVGDASFNIDVKKLGGNLTPTQMALLTNTLFSGYAAATKANSSSQSIRTAMDGTLLNAGISSIASILGHDDFLAAARKAETAAADFKVKTAAYDNLKASQTRIVNERNSLVSVITQRNNDVLALKATATADMQNYNDAIALNKSPTILSDLYATYQASSTAYNNAKGQLDLDYTQTLKPQIDAYDVQIATVNQQLQTGPAGMDSVSTALSDLYAHTTGITEPISWAADTTNKAFVNGLLGTEGRTFNAEQYSVLNGLTAGDDPYADYLSKLGSNEPVYVNYEEAGPAMAAQKQAIYLDVLKQAGVSQAQVTQTEAKRIFQKIETQYGNNASAMQTVVENGSQGVYTGLDKIATKADFIGHFVDKDIYYAGKELDGFNMPIGAEYATPTTNLSAIMLYTDQTTGKVIALTADTTNFESAVDGGIPGGYEPVIDKRTGKYYKETPFASVNIPNSAVSHWPGDETGVPFTLENLLINDPDAFKAYAPTLLENLATATGAVAGGAAGVISSAKDQALRSALDLANAAQDASVGTRWQSFAQKAFTSASNILRYTQIGGYAASSAAFNTVNFLANTYHALLKQPPNSNLLSYYSNKWGNGAIAILPADLQKDVPEFQKQQAAILAEADKNLVSDWFAGDYSSIGSAFAKGISAMGDLIKDKDEAIVVSVVLTEVLQEGLEVYTGAKIGKFAEGAALARGIVPKIASAIGVSARTLADWGIDSSEAFGGTYSDVYQSTYAKLQQSPETKDWTEEQLANYAYKTAVGGAFTNMAISAIHMAPSSAELKRTFFKNVSSEVADSLIANVKKSFDLGLIKEVSQGVYKFGGSIMGEGWEELTEDAPTIAVTNLMLANVAPSNGLFSFSDAIQLAYSAGVGGAVGGTIHLSNIVVDAAGHTAADLTRNLPSAEINSAAPSTFRNSVIAATIAATAALGASPQLAEQVYTAPNAQAAATLLTNAGITDAGMQAQILKPVFTSQITTYADVSNYFAVNPNFSYNTTDISQFLGVTGTRNVQQEVTQYINQNYLTIAQVKSIAANEGVMLTDEQAAQYAGQKNQAAQTAVQQGFDAMAMSYQEVFDSFVNQYGFTPSAADIAQFVGKPEGTATQASLAAYADPRVTTADEVRQMFQDLGFRAPNDSEIAQFTGSKLQSGQKTAVEQYIDPLMVSTDEVKAYLASQGISSPTDADVAKYVGTYNESDLAGKVNPDLTLIQGHATQVAIDTAKQSITDAIKNAAATAASDTDKINAITTAIQKDVGQLLINNFGQSDIESFVKNALTSAGIATDSGVGTKITNAVADIETNVKAAIQPALDSIAQVQSLLGDTHGVPTVADTLAALKIWLGKQPMDTKYDWNGDGKVDLTDVNTLRAAATGHTVPAPAANSGWSQPTGLYKTVADAVSKITDAINNPSDTSKLSALYSSVATLSTTLTPDKIQSYLKTALEAGGLSTESGVGKLINDNTTAIANLQTSLTNMLQDPTGTSYLTTLQNSVNALTANNFTADQLKGFMTSALAPTMATINQIQSLVGTSGVPTLTDVNNMTQAFIDASLNGTTYYDPKYDWNGDGKLDITDARSIRDAALGKEGVPPPAAITGWGQPTGVYKEVANAVATINAQIKTALTDPNSATGASWFTTLNNALATLSAKVPTGTDIQAAVKSVLESGGLSTTSGIGQLIAGSTTAISNAQKAILGSLQDETGRDYLPDMKTALDALAANNFTQAQIETFVQNAMRSSINQITNIQSLLGVSSSVPSVTDVTTLGQLLNSKGYGPQTASPTSGITRDQSGYNAKYDWDGNGVVSYTDLTSMLRAAAGNTTSAPAAATGYGQPTGVYKSVADAVKSITNALENPSSTSSLTAIKSAVASLSTTLTPDAIQSYVKSALEAGGLTTETGIGKLINDNTTAINDAVKTLTGVITQATTDPTGTSWFTTLNTALTTLKGLLGQDNINPLLQNALNAANLDTTQGVGKLIVDQTASITGAISDTQKAIMDKMAEYRAAGDAADVALNKAINDVAGDLGQTKNQVLQSIGKTELDLLNGVNTAKDAITAKMGEYEQSGMARDAALNKAIGDVAAQLGVSTNTLFSAIDTSRVALTAQLIDVKTAIQEQMAEFMSQGQDQYEALSNAMAAVSELVDTTSQETVHQLQAAQTEILQTLGTNQQQLTDLIAQYEQTGLTRDQAIQNAINDLTQQTQENFTTLTDTMGHPSTALTPEDLAKVQAMVNGEQAVDLTYDYTGDHKVDQQDVLAIQQALDPTNRPTTPVTSTPTTGTTTSTTLPTGPSVPPPAAGSRWAPSGLYGQISDLQNQNQQLQFEQLQAIKASQQQTTRQNAVNQLMNYLIGPAAEQPKTTVEAPKVADIKYAYDWSSIFANPTQEGLFSGAFGLKSYASGGSVNDELLNLLRG